MDLEGVVGVVVVCLTVKKRGTKGEKRRKGKRGRARRGGSGKGQVADDELRLCTSKESE